MASISFASESLMDPRIQVKLDKYQKCGNIISQTPKKDVQEALILMTTDAVHVVYWFFFNGWHLFRSQVKA